MRAVVANSSARVSTPHPFLTPSRPGLLQRTCACGGTPGPSGECEECRKKRQGVLQRRATGPEPDEVPPIVHDVLRSPGQPLDAGTRAFMEPRFGHDFSQVRVHTDAVAADSARAVGALAYTVGQDVVFGVGRYDTQSSAGRRLLAHELAHTVQQHGTMATSKSGSPGLQIDDPDGAAEHAAESWANSILGGSDGGRFSASVGGAGGLQRLPDPATRSPAMRCEDAEGSGHPAGHHVEGFSIGGAQLGPAQRAAIASFVAARRATGDQSPVEVHGYASVDGARIPNLSLSCERAEAVGAELVRLGVRASMTLFAHGETDEFGANLPDNRRVIIVGASPPRVVPTVATHRFRVAAASFLSCALCNPFTDDGAFGVTPPTTEPAPGSSFRQLHHIEAELGSTDGRTVAPGTARLVGSARLVGVSGFCGTHSRARLITAAAPGPPRMVSKPSGVQGIEFESELSSRVGAVVPPTLIGAPCGFLGTNPLIPMIGNRFRMRLFADGTKESEFVSATLYPSHHLYEDRAIKTFGGAPVHPAQDFFAWATSTGVPGGIRAAVVGFSALRFACCHPIVSSLACRTLCLGGFSAPSLTFDPAIHAAHALRLAASGCPSACAASGASCTPIVRRSNP